MSQSNKQRTLPLLRGEITLSNALKEDENVLLDLSYPEKRLEFFVYLYGHRPEIASIVAYHMDIPQKQTCRVGEVKEWLHGSFNVCIPVYIEGQDGSTLKRVMIRFPLPYKIGEAQYPGNAEEKLRCETATFLWMQQNCPSVPIPRLWGFSFPQGPCFTAFENLPFFSRVKWYLHRVVSFVFRYPLPPPYLSRKCPFSLTYGYLLMDHVGGTNSEMLSMTWKNLRDDQNRRTNLFRGMSQIILSLAQFPFDRIASLTVDNQGIIKHSNRPLTFTLHQLENESVPTNIDRDHTYSTSDSYFMDLLSYHDSRIRHAPNSIRNHADGESQLAALAIMRALLPHFSLREYRRGPFIMSLTDLSHSNLFVDSDWNITSVVDLEWMCTLPVEKLHPPFWLTGRALDQLEEGENLDAFSKMHAEFMDIFEKEEQAHSRAGHNTLGLTGIMRRGWESGIFWYSQVLETPKGLYNIFLDHIQPRFGKLDDEAMIKFEDAVAPYWAPDVQTFIEGKLKDKEVYERQVRELFAASKEEPDKEDTGEETGKEELSKEETGKEETGKEETGKEETDKEETDKEETDKEEPDKEEVGEEETGKEELSKQELGNQEPASSESPPAN